MTTLATSAAPPELLDALRGLIQRGRQQALRAVDMVQVQTCWEIGGHIVEYEQGGEARATYGKKLLSHLAEALSREFGKGFDASNLRYMRLFYQAFPIRDALRHELSWTHYRMLLRVSSPLSACYSAVTKPAWRLKPMPTWRHCPRRPESSCATQSCLNFWVCPAQANCWSQHWNKP